MSRPRFSVVIPTRNAEKTLGMTLRTCLEQDFDDYEIIVSDNSATSATEELIASINSPRIRRVRPEQTLPMQEHWEFAVEHAEGEFILVLGSDDGLMMHSLKELDKLLRMLDTKLLRWDCVCYNWPDLPQQEHVSANQLLIPLKQTDYYHPIRWRDARQVIADAANSRVSYSELPTIYCSAVHRSLLERMKQETGRIFCSDCPDIYSGFVLAHMVQRYCTLDAPLSINGLSGASNGVATIFLKNKAPIAEDFGALNRSQKSGRNWPAWIPDLPLFCTFSAHSFLSAKEKFFPQENEYSVDRRLLVQNAMREYRSSDEAEWQVLRQIVRQSLSDDSGLQDWFDAEYGTKSLATCPPSPLPPLKRYGGPYMQLDASEFGVTNVWEAALLCEKLLGYKRDGINAHLKPSHASLAPESAERVISAAREGLYQQETEVAALRILAAAMKKKIFIDVGAEKGSFAAVFIEQGFEGTLFEPFAGHLPGLQKLVEGRGSRIFPYAIDVTDHEGRLHIAMDDSGQPLEYFHSLQASPSATNFHHDEEGVPVICRSLDSLAEEGVIPEEVGLLKIDTEGNDLNVMEGMGRVRAEVLMCEFVTPSLYPDWHRSFPEGLMAAAKTMGYEHCIAVRRFHEHEVVEMDPLHFVDGEWGNLIFTSAEILRAARGELDSLRDEVQRKHIAICIRDHGDLQQKEAMIQEQARQLLEKETVIRDQLELCQTLQERNGQKVAKIDELRDKIAALKLKNDNLKAKR